MPQDEPREIYPVVTWGRGFAGGDKGFGPEVPKEPAPTAAVQSQQAAGLEDLNKQDQVPPPSSPSSPSRAETSASRLPLESSEHPSQGKRPNHLSPVPAPATRPTPPTNPNQT